ncbi:hypothetical protein [Lactiplantibacillus plajomi]|uniref:Integral membrane protein n=1 Tax=Lactiplantibacillus plajomi TaxID=1457217 RepID=A0ABV6K7F2_9LACO|nr:hypothetical protein [Lactiplantibacillus plajomi]
MKWLDQHGRQIEWACALLIVIAMVAWQLGGLTRRWTGVIVVVSLIIYWAAVLPRLLREQR